MWHEARQVPSWLIFDVRPFEPFASHTMITRREPQVTFGLLSPRAITLGSLPSIFGDSPVEVCSGQEAIRLGFGSLSSRGRPFRVSLAWSIRSRFLEIFTPYFPSVPQTLRHLPCAASPSASGVFAAVQSPNKALEPTPTVVMPRATLGDLERRIPRVIRTPARGMPAAVVAHL
jgi:hypothetical protein